MCDSELNSQCGNLHIIIVVLCLFTHFCILLDSYTIYAQAKKFSGQKNYFTYGMMVLQEHCYTVNMENLHPYVQISVFTMHHRSNNNRN